MSQNPLTLEDLNPGTIDSSTNLPTVSSNPLTLDDIGKVPAPTFDQRTRNINPYDSVNFSNIYTDPISKYKSGGVAEPVQRRCL